MIEMIRYAALIRTLKRRKIFVSLVMTNKSVLLSWWDSGAHEVKTGDKYSARHYLNLLEENDRREMEFVSHRMERNGYGCR